MDAFTGAGGDRSSRRLSLPVRLVRLLNRPPILRALLFLAPHQVLAQRLRQPCFTGRPLDTLFRGDTGRFAHSAMERERREGVKESLLLDADFPRSSDDHDNPRGDSIRAWTVREAGPGNPDRDSPRSGFRPASAGKMVSDQVKNALVSASIQRKSRSRSRNARSHIQNSPSDQSVREQFASPRNNEFGFGYQRNSLG